jgi:hypothetical protein
VIRAGIYLRKLPLQLVAVTVFIREKNTRVPAFQPKQHRKDSFTGEELSLFMSNKHNNEHSIFDCFYPKNTHNKNDLIVNGTGRDPKSALPSLSLLYY